MDSINKNNQNPLVSIIVITYNSAKYVLETLESAKAQTYQNIELIISDDCSTDTTIAVCEDWLKKNKDRFVRTELITVKENTGIPANCNRGVKATKGTWVKLIAGDDILLENCITDNKAFVQGHINTKFLFSKMNYFGSTINGVLEEVEKKPTVNTRFFEETPKRQHHLLAIGGILIPAPAGFLHTNTLVKLGLFDEEIKLCEDYPMWLKATKNGFQLQFMNVVTVAYRVHNDGIMSSVNLAYEASVKRVFFKYRFQYLLKHKFFLALNLYIKVTTKKHSKLNKLVMLLLPLTYIRYFKNKQHNR